MDIEEGIAEQPAEDNNLRSELAEAFEEAGDDTPVVEETEVVAEASDTTEVTAEAKTPEPDAKTDDKADGKPEAITPPPNWSDDDKGTFDALSAMGEEGRKAQEFLLNRHKSMEGDYTRKNQERADAMRELEPLQKAFEPYAQTLEAQGMTPAGKVQQWADIEMNLNNNPVDTINWLAQQHGVDLSTMEVQQEGVELTGLRRELSDLRNSINNREQADQQARLAAVSSQITAFSELKTEAGDLAHPFFEEVMDDIVALASAERQAGREPELSALYEKAVWMNQSTRDKIMSSQREAEDKKRLDDSRQKAAKAKHAASSVGGTPGGASPTSDLSLREQLSQSMG